MRGTQIFGLVLFTVAAIGCGGGGEGDDGDDDGTDVDASDTDSSIPADFTALIGRDWSLPAGATDTYRCVRLTLTEDTYITSFMAQAPIGTHHTVVSIVSNNVAGPDGDYNCDVAELGTQMLYASGVGTSPLDFPANVGLRIPAGTQIHLNLHLYNASDNPITGTTTVMVKRVASAPPMLAEMVFAGKILFQIPNQQTPYTITGGCSNTPAFTLFAVWPHQHQLGTHHKFEVITGGTPTVLHDEAYNFSEQEYYLQTPEVQVPAGSQIRVTCTWLNTTGGSVPFGESSDDEMCFSGMYRYPATNAGLFSCTDVPGGIPF
jgi:hypothetical protein